MSKFLPFRSLPADRAIAAYANTCVERGMHIGAIPTAIAIGRLRKLYKLTTLQAKLALSNAIPRAAVVLLLCASLTSAMAQATRDAAGNWSEDITPATAAHDSTTTFTYTRAGTLFCMLEEIDHRNKTLGASACASHEFCDANLPMADAWKDVVGRLPEASRADDMRLWDMAWTIAKREGFASPVFSLVATN